MTNLVIIMNFLTAQYKMAQLRLWCPRTWHFSPAGSCVGRYFRLWNFLSVVFQLPLSALQTV